MCGRMVIEVREGELLRLLPQLAGRPSKGEQAARYNVAPGQQVPIVRAEQTGGWSIATAAWGFRPGWLKEAPDGRTAAPPAPINARAETIAQKPLFRKAFQARRCIVPVTGYYEWQEVFMSASTQVGANGKRPVYIHRADGDPLLLAGVWERGTADDTFAVITVAAGETMARLHDRTPAVIEPQDAAKWLDPATLIDRLTSLITSVPDGLLAWHGVGSRVNNPRNQGRELIDPVE